MHFQPTEFKNWPQGESTFGFQAFDSDSGPDPTYFNVWLTIKANATVEELFEAAVKECDDEIWRKMLDKVKGEQSGVYLAGEWYGWEEIQPILEK